jgi:tellurite resistance protein
MSHSPSDDPRSSDPVPASAPIPSSDVANDPDRVLLRLLCCIAWSDGEVSTKERELLQFLATEVLLTDAEKAAAAAEVTSLVADTLGLPAMEALIPQIQGHDQKQLALKLASMVIRVSTAPGESSPINAREKVAYRRLVEGLGLPEEEVQEAEWAAEQDLRQHNNLWSLLASRFAALGAWPDDALLASPDLPRL